MIRLVSRAEDEDRWLAERRLGFTASDANRCLTPSGRRAIVLEKTTGESADLSRIPAIMWGRARERAIMAWVQDRFDIPPNDYLIAGEDPLHRATPDGLLIEDGRAVLGCEVKTSVHEIDPGEYQGQIQWNMNVTGLDRWLLVWERNTGGPSPEPIGEPEWMWVDRDQGVIDALVAEARSIIADVAAGAEPLILTEDDEVAYLAREVLAGRDVEAEGKRLREPAWDKLVALLANRPDAQWKLPGVQVTWSTSASRQTPVIDIEGMEAEDSDLVARYRELEARHTSEGPVKESRRLTITRKD